MKYLPSFSVKKQFSLYKFFMKVGPIQKMADPTRKASGIFCSNKTLTQTSKAELQVSALGSISTSPKKKD